MPEIIALLAIPLIGLLLVFSAIFRLRKKLSQNESPTVGTYINELGGYGLVGVILLVGGVIFAASKFGTSHSVADSESKKPRLREQNDAIEIDESKQAEDASPENHNPTAVLNRLIGHWDIVAEQNGEATVVAKVIASKLEDSPWVIRQMFALDGVLRGIQVTGYHADRSEYQYYRVGIGSDSSHFAGAWDADDGLFTWVKQPPSTDGEILRERVEDTRIEATHEFLVDEVVQQSSTFELRWTQPLLEYNRGSPHYKDYTGIWSSSTKTNVGEGSIDSKQSVIFARLQNTTELVALYFNNHSGNLADIHLIYFDGDDKALRRRWITPAGEPFELEGIASEDKQTIEWSGPVGNGDVLKVTDDFSDKDTVASTLQLESSKGEILMSRTTQLNRIES